MPRYVYECESCEKIFEVAHSIKERLESCECDGPLRRLPSMPLLIKKSSDESVAQKVHKHIRDAKRELAADREQKRKEKEK